MTSFPFYLDCDTGIDDALALAYLLASPHADVQGIGAVSGNVSAAVGARNTLNLLELAGHAHIPVALGAHDPLAGSFGGGAPWVHGANGIGEVELSTAAAGLAPETAAEMLVRLERGVSDDAGAAEVSVLVAAVEPLPVAGAPAPAARARSP